jgi:hypothetical protein
VSKNSLKEVTAAPPRDNSVIEQQIESVEDTLSRLETTLGQMEQSHLTRATTIEAQSQTIRSIFSVLANIQEIAHADAHSLENDAIATPRSESHLLLNLQSAFDAKSAKSWQSCVSKVDDQGVLPLPVGRLSPLLLADTGRIKGTKDGKKIERIAPVGHMPADWQVTSSMLEKPVTVDGREVVPMHPIRLARNLPLSFPGRVLENGYPGSGNVLLINIVTDLLKKRTVPPSAEMESFFEQQAMNAERVQHEAIKSLLTPHGFKEFHAQIDDIEYAWIMCVLHDGNTLLFRAYMGSVYRSPFWSSHERLTRQKFDRFRSMDYDVLLCIRHPYDVIISNAAKILIERKHLIPALLSNYEWFESIAENLADYLHDYVEHIERGEATPVRYEDMIRKPEERITKLAEQLGVSLEDGEAAALWDKYGFKSLQARHMWRPGEGKWMEFLGARHHEILEKLGYRELIARLGYDPVPQSGIRDIPHPSSEDIAEASDRKIIGISELQYAQHYGKRRIVMEPDIIETIDPLLDSTVYASTQHIMDIYFQNTKFRNLLRSFD